MSTHSDPEVQIVATLLVESGSRQGCRVQLSAPRQFLLLGRDPRCGLAFDPVVDSVVGRQHCRLELRPSGLYLIDLQSRNGTYRAQQKLVGEVMLVDGDRVQIGGEGGPSIAFQLEVMAGPAERKHPWLASRPLLRQALLVFLILSAACAIGALLAATNSGAWETAALPTASD